MPKGVYPRNEMHIEICRKGGRNCPVKYQKGHPVSAELREKIGSRYRGKHMPDEVKTKISNSTKGPQNHFYGKKHTNEAKMKVSLKNRGKKPWNYVDGRSKGIGTGRYGKDWRNIRYAVYARDNFTCQECGANDKRLHAHHIVPFMLTRDNSMENLVTLCINCHMRREAKLIKELIKNATDVAED